MQKYSSNIADSRGNAFAFATVAVTDSTGALAQLYSANDVTKPMANPLMTDALSNFSFYAANGRYSWSASGVGFTAGGVTDFSLYDPADALPATLAQLAAAGGAATVGTSDGSTVQAKIDANAAAINANTGNITANAADLSALQLADYTALRAYAGARKSVYVTGYLGAAAPSGIAGLFVRDDHDTTTADNGGTVIVTAGSVRWKRQFSGNARVSWFGVIGAGNDRTIVQAAVNACKVGGTLDFGNLTYDLGTVASATWAVLIDSPVGMRLIGNGAQIHCTCTAGRASAFAVKNPLGFSSDGLEFSQPGYLIGSTGGTSSSANGTYGFLLFASAPFTADAPCGNVTINGAARDCAGFVTVDATTQLGAVSPVFYAMRNVKVTGVCERIFYGFSSVYGAVDTDAKLVCRDVRRGVVTYGHKKGNFDLTLECSSGFVGSNAFVEIACEGQTTGNVQDIDVRVKVTGCEAHSNIVYFYHQQNEAAGSIGNVRARVTLDNLNVTGKDASVGATNVFGFGHENTSGANLGTTARTWDNLDIDCDVLGTISGSSMNMLSLPATQVSSISLGRGVTALLTNFNQWFYFKVMRGAKTLSFTPGVFGRTSAGAAAYSVQKAMMSIDNGVASYSISLSWSGHTGTGNMYVTPLPVKAITSATIGNPVAAVLASGFGAAGAQIGALITGQGDEFTVYSVDGTSRAAATPAVPVSGSIYMNGTFPLYA
jgi:hypothetical protein